MAVIASVEYAAPTANAAESKYGAIECNYVFASRKAELQKSTYFLAKLKTPDEVVVGKPATLSLSIPSVAMKKSARQVQKELGITKDWNTPVWVTLDEPTLHLEATDGQADIDESSAVAAKKDLGRSVDGGGSQKINFNLGNDWSVTFTPQEVGDLTLQQLLHY